MKLMEAIEQANFGAWIILKDGEVKGKIIAKYPQNGVGRLRVALWDWETYQDIQEGWAGGYGYDKLSAALAGMSFNGIRLTDHPHDWERLLKEAGYKVQRLL